MFGGIYMKKLFMILGRSNSGKDSIYSKLLKYTDLSFLIPYTPYTTRPMRKDEINGKNYKFISESDFYILKDADKVLEYRSYETNKGIWIYATIDDEQLKSGDFFLTIGTLESYNSLKQLNKFEIIPIYLNVDEYDLLIRYIEREHKEKNPNYNEVCRRFIADSKDFSEEKLKKAGITKVFNNNNLQDCTEEIKSYILSFFN